MQLAAKCVKGGDQFPITDLPYPRLAQPQSAACTPAPRLIETESLKLNACISEKTIVMYYTETSNFDVRNFLNFHSHPIVLKVCYVPKWFATTTSSATATSLKAHVVNLQRGILLKYGCLQIRYHLSQSCKTFVRRISKSVKAAALSYPPCGHNHPATSQDMIQTAVKSALEPEADYQILYLWSGCLRPLSTATFKVNLVLPPTQTRHRVEVLSGPANISHGHMNCIPQSEEFHA